MSKKNPWHWYYGIPEFHMAHHFVYLNDLKYGPHNENRPSIYLAKQNLYTEASSAAADTASTLSQKDTIDNALEFLKAAADNERNKELLVIKDYHDHLKDILPEDDAKIKELLSKINTNILENPEEIKDFYLELTKYINQARQNTEDYYNRLMRFQSHNDKEMSELAKDSYEFRALGDTESLINNLVGTATRAQEKGLEKFTGKLRQATFDFITQSDLIPRLQSGEDVIAAFTMVQLDIEKKCQQFLDEHFDEYTDLAELTDELDNIIDNYLYHDEEQDTKLQKAINNNDEQLNLMLDATKNILGLKELKSGRAARSAQSDTRTKLLNEKASLRKQLRGIIKEEILEQMKYITTSIPKVAKKTGEETISRKTFHGNLYELIEVIQEGNTIKVRGKNGTDIIHLGSMLFDIQPSNLQASLLKPIKRIETLMTDYDAQKRKDRNDSREKAHKKMNKEIHRQVKILEKELKDNKLKIDNLFVYHESIKLYKSAETNELSTFKGRDMIILNYLDELYTANGLAQLSLPQKESLEFLALNLSSAAVGSEYKSTLENYLSIFAGLLMFDDIYNMAKEADKMLKKASPYKTVKQIHLYNLNGIYVPASMILTYIYTTMKQVEDAIDDGLAATVQINEAGATQAANAYLETRPVPIKPEWKKLGDAASSGTKIRIIFLSNFVQLISELNELS